MEQPEFRRDLEKLLTAGRTDLLGFVAGLSEAERNERGSFDRWSAKDLVGHILAWESRVADVLASALEGNVPEEMDWQVENPRIYERYRSRSWQELNDQEEGVFVHVVDLLGRLGQADLVDGARFAWRNGQPLLGVVTGNFFWHPKSHIAGYYHERGQVPALGQMDEDAVKLSLRVDNTPHGRGVALYNLACYYATTGRAEQALAPLRESLELRPDLRAWAREDPDLIPLRGRRDFEEATRATGSLRRQI